MKLTDGFTNVLQLSGDGADSCDLTLVLNYVVSAHDIVQNIQETGMGKAGGQSNRRGKDERRENQRAKEDVNN